jgi:hypothetical protein
VPGAAGRTVLPTPSRRHLGLTTFDATIPMIFTVDETADVGGRYGTSEDERLRVALARQ